MPSFPFSKVDTSWSSKMPRCDSANAQSEASPPRKAPAAMQKGFLSHCGLFKKENLKTRKIFTSQLDLDNACVGAGNQLVQHPKAIRSDVFVVAVV